MNTTDAPVPHTSKRVRRKAQRRVVRLMAKGRYTLKDLAVAFGYPVSTVHRWATGTLPRADAALKILAVKP